MKKIFGIILAIILVVSLQGCASNPSEPTIPQDSLSQSKVSPIVFLPDLINKSMQEIELELGKPDSVEKVSPSGTSCKTNPCDKGIYSGGKLEIIFIDGFSDRITINNTSNYILDSSSIMLLGLQKTNPTFINPGMVIRWENIGGIRELSFFDNGSNKIDYISIKAKTE